MNDGDVIGWISHKKGVVEGKWLPSCIWISGPRHTFRFQATKRDDTNPGNSKIGGRGLSSPSFK